MSFSYQREVEFLAKVNIAQDSLRSFQAAMKDVRLPKGAEEDIADFTEYMHATLAGLAEACHRNLKR